MNLTKLSQRLGRLEAEAKDLKRREPFYNAAAVDAELEALFNTLHQQSLAAPGASNPDDMGEASFEPDASGAEFMTP